MNYINLSVVCTDRSSLQLFMSWWHTLCNIETAQWLLCKWKQELIFFFCDFFFCKVVRVFIYNCICILDIGRNVYLCVCWWGKGWLVVACPSRALVVLYQMFTIFACYVLTFMFGRLLLFLTTFLWCFVHGFCFSNNGLNKLPWTSYLHAILRIISRGVSGLATDSPCGVWGHGWTTCLLHDIPLFSSHFKMRVGM